MARRPAGRGGLLGTAARTAVVAGTATAVVGGMQHRQQGAADAAGQQHDQPQQDQVQQAAAQQAAAQQAPTAPGPADPVAEIERLADMKAQGILTDEEFAAAKAKLLGI